MQKTNCYTYFRITGDFDPTEITERLKLTADKTWKATDLRHNGEPYGFSSWEFGKCDEYNVDLSVQARKVIAPLLSKIDILNEIRQKFDVTLCLEVVPELYCGETHPVMPTDLDILEFCCATQTHLDIDYYVVGDSYED